jgi:prolyl oligopeptidase
MKNLLKLSAEYISKFRDNIHNKSNPLTELLIFFLCMTFIVECSLAQSFHYPSARRDTSRSMYFGSVVPTPYQWMENQNSPEVTAWVEAENKLTFDYLDKISLRSTIKKRLTKLWNYERVGIPVRSGGSGPLFYTKNSGLQNQSPIFMQQAIGAKADLILDPNKLSPDGSIALSDYAPSPDTRYLCYALSQGGSDWQELHIKDLQTGKDLPDTVKWVKFSSISWTNDGKGLFYSRFPAPAEGTMLTSEANGQQLYYHSLGTSQRDDKKFYDLKDLPGWYVGGFVTEDGRYVFISVNKGTDPKNKLYVVDLKDPQHPDLVAPVRPLFEEDDAEHYVLGTVGSTVFMQTTLRAPKRKIVSFDIAHPENSAWTVVVPEGKNVIEGDGLIAGRVVAQYLEDAKSKLEFYSLNGRYEETLHLPGIGTVGGFSGRFDGKDLFYSFTSYLYPTTVFHYDFTSKKQSAFQPPHVSFAVSEYETKQVFYPSKDGTRIPMFITMKKRTKLDGTHPTLLYAYGGFNISTTPAFSTSVAVWLERGGIYAVANLRGGGEYGQAWHEAGMKEKKQNVFDDFIAAAEYLIKEKYTSPSHLGIEGASNGGLLVGAVEIQRPELFGAVHAAVGVMDMLRYQKFSAGVGWVPEFGSSDDSTEFQYIFKYSPLHNIKSGVEYPPTLVTTADHDDRVVPSHSYKFTAAMQHAQAGDHPILIRVETQTSHGYMPTDKRIAQSTDILAFLAYNLGIRTP